MRLVFATNNRHKIEEIREIVGSYYDITPLGAIGCHEDIPETGATLEENALQKARYVAGKYHVGCFADDTGLEVRALGGLPGVHSARFASETGHDSEANMRKLLSIMKDEEDRAARFRTVIALIGGKGEDDCHLFEGVVNGHIAREKHGKGGFGYDPLFIPDGSVLSFAEMSREEKNLISHRGKAARLLADFLRKNCLLFCLLLSFLSPSRAAIGSWKAYMSYHEIKKICPAGNTVYVLASDNLYSYNSADGSIITYDKVNFLSDCDIIDIAWCTDEKKLVVVYENGNIDIINRDLSGTVNISDFYSKAMTIDKTAGSVYVYGSCAYVCTAFGALKINIARGEISDTYNLGVNVVSVAVKDGNILLSAPGNGLWLGKTSDNLTDKSYWRKVNESHMDRLMIVDGEVVGYVDGSFFKFNLSTNNYEGIIATGEMTSFHNADGIVTASDGNTTWQINGFHRKNFLSYDTPGKYFVAYNSADGVFWCAENNFLSAFTVYNSDITTTVSGIAAEGPKYNFFYYSTFKNNTLYTTGGYHATNLAEMYRPGTVQLLCDDEWTILEDNIDTITGRQYLDQNCVTVDPNDPLHIFASGKTGLYEFYDTRLKKIYFPGDGLMTYADIGGEYENYILTYSCLFDNSSNLWILQSLSDHPFVTLNADGTWDDHASDLLMNDGKGLANLTGLMMDSRGFLWFVNYNWELPALFRYDISDGVLTRYSTFVNQDGTTVENCYPTCVAEDKEGNIWVGTTVGPLLLYADDVISGSAVFTQVKVPRLDGTGYADYLLSGLYINGVTVDGANRKWFATSGNGAYLISNDNLEQIYNFTSDNSSLLSSNVESIAINDNSGEVFFLTSYGLCSFMSDASSSNEKMTKENVWAYPNPVTPDYNGLITVTGLSYHAYVKITTSSGYLVNEGTSNGGLFTWDGTDKSGKRVNSGVYYVLTATSEGHVGIVCKIAVIR